ncbi:MAG TPA: hypothetical protein VMR52_10470 [Dehalococcoidia bacterium]|nr:hypothetical protein [Dehalococcoidia bacterium]
MPKGSSIISVRHMLEGAPFAARTQPLGSSIVDGEECTTGILLVFIDTIVNKTLWPWSDSETCNRTGVLVRICEGLFPTICSEEFVFEGADVLVELDYGAAKPSLLEEPRVLVEFGHNGIPQGVTLKEWQIISPEIQCSSGAEFPAQVSQFVALWPTSCRVEGADFVGTFVTEEFGELEATFRWEDTLIVKAQVDTGALLETPTPSATATTAPESDTPGPVTHTPAELPDTGGNPSRPSEASWWPLLLLLPLGAGASVLLARRKHREARVT